MQRGPDVSVCPDRYLRVHRERTLDRTRRSEPLRGSPLAVPRRLPEVPTVMMTEEIGVSESCAHLGQTMQDLDVPVHLDLQHSHRWRIYAQQGPCLETETKTASFALASATHARNDLSRYDPSDLSPKCLSHRRISHSSDLRTTPSYRMVTPNRRLELHHCARMSVPSPRRFHCARISLR